MSTDKAWGGRFTEDLDDAASARLIATLVQGGVAVVEATPDESRLERLFLGPAGGAS